MKLIVATCLILVIIIFRLKFGIFNVVSGSMEPTIEKGSLVLVKRNPVYRTNDIISFKNTTEDIIMTHRIVKIEQSRGECLIFTKGDNNTTNDRGTIRPENVIGKVVIVMPFVGKFSSTISSQKFLPITFYLPAGLAFGTLLKKLKHTK